MLLLASLAVLYSIVLLISSDGLKCRNTPPPPLQPLLPATLLRMRQLLMVAVALIT